MRGRRGWRRRRRKGRSLIRRRGEGGERQKKRVSILWTSREGDNLCPSQPENTQAVQPGIFTVSCNIELFNCTQINSPVQL